MGDFDSVRQPSVGASAVVEQIIRPRKIAGAKFDATSSDNIAFLAYNESIASGPARLSHYSCSMRGAPGKRSPASHVCPAVFSLGGAFCRRAEAS